MWKALLVGGVLAAAAAPRGEAVQEERKIPAPELEGGVGWLNTDRPITLAELRGKIVLLEFWTYC
jgi:hypothetical protein